MTMALPPLAAVSDLAAWIGQEIPDADPRAGAVLSHAANRVWAYLYPQTWEAPEDIPAIVSDVTVRVAARAYLNLEELDSVSVDDATKRWGDVRGLVLTAEDRADLDQYRGAPRAITGMGTVSTYRDDGFGADTVYVPTGPPPSGYPFPWYGSDDPLAQ